MTRNNLKIFLRILIGAVIAVVVSVPVDILIVFIDHRLRGDSTGHGGGLYTRVLFLAVVTVTVSFILLLIKSIIDKQKEKRQEGTDHADIGESD